MYTLTQPVNQSFTGINIQTPIESCGDSPLAVPSGCCYSMLNNPDLQFYSSFSQKVNSSSNIPASANGNQYCHLTSSNQSSLLGFAEIYYLADGSCIDKHFKCNPNGKFQYFTGEGCGGESQSVVLTEKRVQLLFPNLGIFTGQIIHINDASVQYKWTAFIPPQSLTYAYVIPMEILSLICYILSIIFTLTAAVYIFKMFLKSRAIYELLMIMSLVLWIIWVCADLAFMNLTLTKSKSIYLELEDVVFSLASLFTVVNSIHLIVKFHRVRDEGILFLSYGILMTVHLLVGGSGYFSYFKNGELSGVFRLWFQLRYLWIILVLLFDTLSYYFISVGLIKKFEYSKGKSIVGAIWKLFSEDSKLTALIFIQTVNTLLYFVLFVIQNYSLVLANDRNFIALNGIYALQYTVHACLNCVWIDHIRELLRVYLKFAHSKLISTAPHLYSINTISPPHSTFTSNNFQHLYSLNNKHLKILGEDFSDVNSSVVSTAIASSSTNNS